jgi:methylenetetrahydrofolate dehydrogenase (NADP+)/methenyltetrahydrofolate cyclohydrolase
MGQVLDGKAVSAKVLDRIALAVPDLPVRPCLAVILVGDDPASHVYVANKEKACARVGFRSLKFVLPAAAGAQALLERIAQLNADDSVHGILCQLPLPKGYDYDEAAVCRAISPAKDVDCFHPETVGRLTLGDPVFFPCTPMGVLELLADAGIRWGGKHVVIVGRSNIVGKPMALLARMCDATVTICHSRTHNLAQITRQADILIAAVGKLHFITADMVKEGAVVVDVGINRLEGKKVRGDVDFDNVVPKASYITPVPGGCGPMTIATLMTNTLKAADAAQTKG